MADADEWIFMGVLVCTSFFFSVGFFVFAFIVAQHNLWLAIGVAGAEAAMVCLFFFSHFVAYRHLIKDKQKK